jgi:N-formylglutamate amidohydrolase
VAPLHGYVKTTDGRPLREHLTAAERARLIETWYPPIIRSSQTPRLRDELVAAASAAGFSVLVDRPFAGALVPATYYRREPRVRAVMIEINRRLYMHEQTGERLLRLGEISQAVSKMLAAVGALQKWSHKQPDERS